MIIGISGKIGSGKDEVARRLCAIWGFKVLRLADALREELLERVPRTLAALHALEQRNLWPVDRCACIAEIGAPTLACLRDMIYNRKPLGVRELLQEWGTDLRRREDSEYWCKRWRERVANLTGHVVVPDVRFQNEVQAVRDQGGLLWRVERPGTALGEHESERLLDGWSDWDAVIQNDGTLADLYAQVDGLVARKAA